MLPDNNLVKDPQKLQYFLLVDVIFVILLLSIIIRQLILIIIYRKRNNDESKLYIKFVNLFAAASVKVIMLLKQPPFLHPRLLAS